MEHQGSCIWWMKNYQQEETLQLGISCDGYQSAITDGVICSRKQKSDELVRPMRRGHSERQDRHLHLLQNMWSGTPWPGACIKFWLENQLINLFSGTLTRVTARHKLFFPYSIVWSNIMIIHRHILTLYFYVWFTALSTLTQWFTFILLTLYVRITLKRKICEQ